jgi:hypothetical protein
MSWIVLQVNAQYDSNLCLNGYVVRQICTEIVQLLEKDLEINNRFTAPCIPVMSVAWRVWRSTTKTKLVNYRHN